MLHRTINSHCFDITQWRNEQSPVAEKFNGLGNTLADVTVMAIDQLYSHDSCLRKIRESKWIRTLGTSYPFWTNLRVDFCEICVTTIYGLFGGQPRLIPRLLAFPRSSNYVSDIVYKYTVYNKNNVFWSQILREASQKAKTLEDECADDVHLCIWSTINSSKKH